MISHKHKFIFVHISKSAGCSIEAIFGIEHLEFVNPEQPNDRRHTKLGEYRSRFPDLFDRYFKFVFVRNPWARIVSRYANHQQINARKRASLDEAAATARAIADARKSDHKLARIEAKRARLAANPYNVPFREWIVGANMGNQLHEGGVDMEPYFDFVGRFERLHDDFQTVCRHIGLNVTLPHVNRSDHRHYTRYYDDASRAIVAEKCAHDIERFGYRFGD